MPSYHESPADTNLVAFDIAPTIGTTNTNGVVVDMSGWDGCLFLFNIGPILATGTFDARIVSSANSSMTGNANIANAALTQVVAAGNTNAYAIDIWRPTLRYLRSAAVPATANVAFSSLTVRYRGAGVTPVALGATALAQLVKVAQN
ncbi:MAG TPA: hypothetical protein VFB50_13155 [Chloroflexota bacterium]|nr:hypothetical protein [Chloroflexota bacterium]